MPLNRTVMGLIKERKDNKGINNKLFLILITAMKQRRKRRRRRRKCGRREGRDEETTHRVRESPGAGSYPELLEKVYLR